MARAKKALSADVVPLTTTQKAARKAAGVETPPTKVVITPPKLATATVTIIGKAPYLQNRFSSENRDKMMETQKAGSAAKRTRKAKAPKDFDKLLDQSQTPEVLASGLLPQQLGWEPKTRFVDLVKLMVDADIKLLKDHREGRIKVAGG